MSGFRRCVFARESFREYLKNANKKRRLQRDSQRRYRLAKLPASPLIAEHLSYAVQLANRSWCQGYRAERVAVIPSRLMSCRWAT